MNLTLIIRAGYQEIVGIKDRRHLKEKYHGFTITCLVSLEMIFEAPIRFKFQTLSKKTLKIPEHNLGIYLEVEHWSATL